METIKGAVDSAKQAMGSTTSSGATGAGGEQPGMAHKTAPEQETGTHVVRSLEEAGHRMQEQQGADNPGFYDVQAKFTDAVKRGNEKLSSDK